jgi:glycosyltransferase involved in cell wall biosynthesis
MAPAPIAVTLSLGNGSWQEGLADTLLKSGSLRRVLRFRPDLEVQEPNGSGALKTIRTYDFSFARKIAWGLWTRAPGKEHSRLPVVANVWLADRLASKWAASGNVFHGWTAMCLASLRRAKRAGAATFIEYPALHPRRWQQEVLAECERFGVDPALCPAILPERLIQRIEREFAECETIVVPSTPARRSMQGSPYLAKTEVVLPGVDHHFFSPSPHSPLLSVFRVIYVGRIELSKGVTYLLQAWKRLALPNAEVVLIGECRAEMQPLLREYAGATVRATGPLSAKEVAEWYRQASVFVFPSVNDGFGIVLLEAMASGLPVIATEETGGDDCVTHGRDGFVVPKRNTDALAETIAWCYEHRCDLRTMGKAARATIEAQFTLQHYDSRIVHLYHAAVANSADPRGRNRSASNQLPGTLAR